MATEPHVDSLSEDDIWWEGKPAEITKKMTFAEYVDEIWSSKYPQAKKTGGKEKTQDLLKGPEQIAIYEEPPDALPAYIDHVAKDKDGKYHVCIAYYTFLVTEKFLKLNSNMEYKSKDEPLLIRSKANRELDTNKECKSKDAPSVIYVCSRSIHGNNKRDGKDCACPYCGKVGVVSSIKRHCNERTVNGKKLAPACAARRTLEPAVNGKYEKAKKPICFD